MYCIEDLKESGLRIAVEKPGFTYGHDAVLLAGFARIKKQDKLLDLGCGCGILAILLERRTGAETYGVDIRPEACALTRESARLNGQAIHVLEQDLRTLALAPGQRPFDAIVCNPPYFAGGTPSPDPARRVCTLRQRAVEVWGPAVFVLSCRGRGGMHGRADGPQPKPQAAPARGVPGQVPLSGAAGSPQGGRAGPSLGTGHPGMSPFV